MKKTRSTFLSQNLKYLCIKQDYRMRFYWLITSFILFYYSVSTSLVFGQQESKKFRELFVKASADIFDGNYPKALEELNALEQLDPGNANIHYLKGLCYLKPPLLNAKKAIHQLKFAASNLTATYSDSDFREYKAPYFALKFLGDAYHLNYQFDEAIGNYQRLKDEFEQADQQVQAELDQLIETSKRAKSMVSAPINMEIRNIGSTINTFNQEYFPFVNADQSMLVFTSKRKGCLGGINEFTGTYNEDIFYATKNANGTWSKPKAFKDSINTYAHDASIGLSADGQTLWIYRYHPNDGGDLFKSTLNGKTWTTPQRLSSDINSSFWEGSVSVSADKSKLFFSSDRPGGYGGKDLYFCNRLPNGEWALAQNCGPNVNTDKDENTPYIHPDGVTLFFSSKGHTTMGGYDLFFSELTDEQWSKPFNIGYPVNTPGDDMHFKPNIDRQTAYYSSYKTDGYGKQDIYLITFPNIKKTPLTVYKGNAVDSKGQTIEDLFITVSDDKTAELIGNYVPNASTGKYIIILKPGKSYRIEYENAQGVLHAETIEVPENSNYHEINKELTLDPVKIAK